MGNLSPVIKPIPFALMSSVFPFPSFAVSGLRNFMEIATFFLSNVRLSSILSRPPRYRVQVYAQGVHKIYLVELILTGRVYTALHLTEKSFPLFLCVMLLENI